MLFLVCKYFPEKQADMLNRAPALLHPVVSFRPNLTTNLFGRPDLQNSNNKKPANHSLEKK